MMNFGAYPGLLSGIGSRNHLQTDRLSTTRCQNPGRTRLQTKRPTKFSERRLMPSECEAWEQVQGGRAESTPLVDCLHEQIEGEAFALIRRKRRDHRERVSHGVRIAGQAGLGNGVLVPGGEEVQASNYAPDKVILITAFGYRSSRPRINGRAILVA